MAAATPIEIKRPECTKGYIFGYTFAPKCAGWRCQCPLDGKCVPPAAKKICFKPCDKHFPERPYECQGGRGRILPSGCEIWQCNCPWEIMGRCKPPREVCSDDCKKHDPNCRCYGEKRVHEQDCKQPKCRRCWQIKEGELSSDGCSQCTIDLD